MQPTGEQPDLLVPGLSPPRYSLRTLLVVVTLCGCLFGVMATVGMFYSAMLALFLSLVGAHVVGNSLGTKLRDQTTQQIDAARAARPPAPAMSLPRDLANPPRRLTERARLHRITLVMGIGGAMLGGELGGVGLSATYPEAPISAVALGVVSSATLGAFVGFLTSSFLSVVRQALAEAHRGANPSVTRPASGGPRSF
jgi:hypothetical protein